MKLYHDSRSLDCRAPFGAVRCGDIVRLRVYCQGRPRAVNAVITLNNQPYTIPLQPDGRDGYELRFAAPATPRLLWYYFAAVMENGQTEYLGNARDGLGGVGETYASAPPSFQLTVYARDYAPPAFLREGVMYQIFPDRFCRSRAPRYTREDIYLHENWDEPPLALFDPRNGDTHSRDFFGGDLQGVISRLDYLQSLHVTVLYLNPIFLARSNHRYDTDINELKLYFNSVIDWVSGVFTQVEPEMRGLEWGRLYETYHKNSYNPQKVEKEVNTLLADDYITNARGIFEYILSGNTMPQLLTVRVFDENTKRKVYKKQTAEANAKGISNCPLCAQGHEANKTKIWALKDMDADHVTAWSKGGGSDISNCQLLCKTHNRAKGNR